MAGNVPAPGEAGCMMNYGLGQQVLQTTPFPGVLAAKEEVRAKYKQDTLGLRRGTETSDCKYGPHASNQRQWSEITPSRIGVDVRILKSMYRDDGKRYHAFDRGHVTTGWQHSTVGADELQRQRATERLTARSLRLTLARTRHLSQYRTPAERVALQTEAARAAKLAQRLPEQELREKFGAEGAAHVHAIREILKRRGEFKPRRLRACKADLEAVRKLSLSDDEEEGAALRKLPRSDTSIREAGGGD